jgi:CDP-glucose 4,6-dehydratase
LSGYLALGQALATRPALNGEPFNFGPRAEQNRTVLELLSALSKQWGFTKADDAYTTADAIPFHEAGLLKVNCDKALFHLKWQPTLDFDECVQFVADWYLGFYKHKQDMFDFTARQIDRYCERAVQRSLAWAQ